MLGDEVCETCGGDGQLIETIAGRRGEDVDDVSACPDCNDDPRARAGGYIFERFDPEVDLAVYRWHGPSSDAGGERIPFPPESPL